MCTNRDRVVSNILTMHQEDYEYINNLLFELDPDSPVESQAAPIFTAANIGSCKLFEALLTKSKIPPSIILQKKQQKSICLPDGTCFYHVDTPLSLIISKPENYPLIDTLDNLDESKFVTSIDLSHTRTRCLPVDLFKLRHIYHIDVSNNKLSQISLLKMPPNCWPNLNLLKELNISYNSLECVPLEFFTFSSIKTLNVSHNSLKTLPEKWWSSKSLSVLDISFNINLESLALDEFPSALQFVRAAYYDHEFSQSTTKRIRGSISRSNFQSAEYCIASQDKSKSNLLQHLNASNCSINRFPNCLALIFPKLEILNLSHNKLEVFCSAINELPPSLECLDISNNLLNFHSELFYIDHASFMQSEGMCHRDLSNLKTLKLANNLNLRTVYLSDEVAVSQKCHAFFPNLLRLDLSNCGLEKSICHLEHLKKLTDLDISRNKHLALPTEICNLENLINFTYDGLLDPIVKELNIFNVTQEKQLYLYERK